MIGVAVSSAERLDTALSFRPPDRVPFFLPAHLQAARRLGLGVRECLETPEHVVAAQLLLRDWLGHDVVSAAVPAAFELEPWGGSVEFVDNGPPVAGPPPMEPDDIPTLEPPSLSDSPRLLGALRAIEMLRARVGDAVPVMGSIVSPFSLPLIQLGFERYLEVLVERPAEFQRLMEVNAAFCLEWATAQVNAGATMIAYYDPMSSPTCVPVDTARELGLPIARRLLPFIGAPFAVHFASGHSIPLLDDLVALGATAVGIGAQEDVAVALERSRRRIGIVGNLNGVAMCGWSPADARAAAAHLRAAGAGGGLIVADCHGEIPYPVQDDILSTIAETIRQGAPEAGD